MTIRSWGHFMGYSAQSCENSYINNEYRLFFSQSKGVHQRQCLVFSLFNGESLMWFNLETHATFCHLKLILIQQHRIFFFIFAIVLTEGLSFFTLNVIKHFNSILIQSSCELMGKNMFTVTFN